MRRVRFLVHFFELHDRDPRVDLCRREILVTEQRLDVPDVGSVLEHVGCAGMPEQVTSGIRMCIAEALQRGRLDRFLHDARELLAGHRLAMLGQEQIAVVLAVEVLRPDGVDVLLDPGASASESGARQIQRPKLRLPVRAISR